MRKRVVSLSVGRHLEVYGQCWTTQRRLDMRLIHGRYIPWPFIPNSDGGLMLRIGFPSMIREPDEYDR